MRLVLTLTCLLAHSPALADDDVAIRSDSTVADGDWRLQLGLGLTDRRFADDGGSSSELAGLASLGYGLSDRLTLEILTPALAYRFGDRGSTELVLVGGITGWSIGKSSVEGWIGSIDLGAGATARRWLSVATALNAGATIESRARWGQRDIPELEGSHGPVTWGGSASLGLSQHLGERWTLNAGGRASAAVVLDGQLVETAEQAGTEIAVGSVQFVGVRSLPLIAFQMSDLATIDLHGSLAYEIETRTVEATYMAGTTMVW